VETNIQWRRQHSKGTRSFWGQKILKSGQVTRTKDAAKGSPVLKYLIDLHCTYCTPLPKQSNRQGAAMTVDLPARSLDLARPGVATPVPTIPSLITATVLYWNLFIPV